MKCPSCGADMKGQTVCSQCGKSIEDLPPGIEVEYKDFKVSELLEIRAKDHRTPSERPDIEEAGAQDPANEPREAETLRHEKRESTEEPGRYNPGIQEGKRSSPFLLALVLFLVALIASAFLIWKLFTR